MRFEVIPLKRDNWDKTRYVIFDNLSHTWPKELQRPLVFRFPIVSYTTKEEAQKYADKKNSSRMSVSQYYIIEQIKSTARDKIYEESKAKKCSQ